MTGSDRIGLCAPGPSGVHILADLSVYTMLWLCGRNILIPSTAVTPEIQGSTRAPVLRRGGRTARGLVPGVGRVKSAGLMKCLHLLSFFGILLTG